MEDEYSTKTTSGFNGHSLVFNIVRVAVLFEDTDILVTNVSDPTFSVSAKSSLELLRLVIIIGDDLMIRARGRQARLAADTVASLFSSSEEDLWDRSLEATQDIRGTL